VLVCTDLHIEYFNCRNIVGVLYSLVQVLILSVLTEKVMYVKHDKVWLTLLIADIPLGLILSFIDR